MHALSTATASKKPQVAEKRDPDHLIDDDWLGCRFCPLGSAYGPALPISLMGKLGAKIELNAPSFSFPTNQLSLLTTSILILVLLWLNVMSDPAMRLHFYGAFCARLFLMGSFQPQLLTRNDSQCQTLSLQVRAEHKPMTEPVYAFSLENACRLDGR